MKTNKNIALIAILIFISVSSYAQLKVDQYGRIGMGTNWPNPEFKCHIKGNLLLTNYPSTPTYELRTKVGNGSPGVDIGSSGDKIAFWSRWVGYNDLYAAQFYKQSDSTLKSNIQPIQGGLDRIMKLNVYSYNVIDNSFSRDMNKVEGMKREYGFLSQEVEELFPDVKITADAKGVKLMDYDQIIPLLVASTKEQQEIINSLEEKVSDLEAKVDLLSNGGTTDIDETLKSSKTILHQNRPNPFNEKTIIKYNIQEENFQSGSILIFDMNGTLLKTYPASSGENELTMNGRELKAGMYIYALVVNDKEIDTKRMILMK